jgi:Fe-S cluster assembly scaffold protein SufB
MVLRHGDSVSITSASRDGGGLLRKYKSERVHHVDRAVVGEIGCRRYNAGKGWLEARLLVRKYMFSFAARQTGLHYFSDATEGETLQASDLVSDHPS